MIEGCCPEPVHVPPKCGKFHKELKSKKVNLTACGSKDNNTLLSLLKCVCKEEKICSETLKKYMACHGSVMGAGSYQGRRNCELELKDLINCVNIKDISNNNDGTANIS